MSEAKRPFWPLSSPRCFRKLCNHVEVPRIHLRVVGRVQGVGFRWFVREQARARGLAGWVRNTSDGGVELQAEGSTDALAALTEAVRTGPSASQVTEVVIVPSEILDSLTVPFIAIR